MGIDIFIKIFIGTFLFGIFGEFINDIIYYITISWQYIYNVFYFLFDLMGMSSFGETSMTLLYYAPILGISYIIIRKFVIL